VIAFTVLDEKSHSTLLTLQLTGELIIESVINRVTNMELQLKVPDMACGACGETITKAIKAIDAHAVVQTDTQTKLVSIRTQVAETAIRAAIINAGYSVV
jgi:copper chaperone